MDIKSQCINGMLRLNPLKKGETIEDDFDINELSSLICDISYWWRHKKDCPFARGNLLLDFKFKNGELFCLKFPYQTTYEEIKEYLCPLLNLLEQKQSRTQH